MIERFHRSLKASLRAGAADSNWISHLSLVLLGLCSVPKEELPASLVNSQLVFVCEVAS